MFSAASGSLSSSTPRPLTPTPPCLGEFNAPLSHGHDAELVSQQEILRSLTMLEDHGRVVVVVRRVKTVAREQLFHTPRADAVARPDDAPVDCRGSTIGLILVRKAPQLFTGTQSAVRRERPPRNDTRQAM